MITRLIYANNAIWDAGLAVIAVLLSYAIVWVARARLRKPVRYGIMIPLALAWLAFLPNTCYLITEWRHFLEVIDSHNLFILAEHNLRIFTYVWTLWFFYFLFSGFGMIAFTLAIRPIKHLAARRGAAVWFWMLPFFTLLSLGVFLGLVLRFNSWDLATRPGIVWNAVMQISGSPKLLALILGFAIFLWVSFEVFDIWVDGLTERISKRLGRRVHMGPRVD